MDRAVHPLFARKLDAELSNEGAGAGTNIGFGLSVCRLQLADNGFDMALADRTGFSHADNDGAQDRLEGVIVHFSLRAGFDNRTMTELPGVGNCVRQGGAA